MFWLRWTVRDLRRRWVQVVATALVIAIGIAVFAGLGGMRGWREDSASASFKKLYLHDIRVTLAQDNYAEQGQLLAALRRLPDSSTVLAAREQLVVPTQIDGPGAKQRVLAPGRIVGVSTGRGEPVDELHVIRGRGLASSTTDAATKPVAVIDRSFAKYYEMPDSGRLKLPGGKSLDYTGHGQTPQYFLITSETGFGGEATLGVLFTPLATAQQLAGRPDQVNELVVRFAPGTDLAVAKRQVEAAVDEQLPGIGTDLKLGHEEQAYTILFRDAKNDQRQFTVFGLLVLLGACVAAFNLVSRTVEAERREIGIGMALGVRPALLGVRPLLLGAEIALLGALLGALLTAWLANAFTEIFKQFLPLPAYGEAFRPAVYARGAAVGFLLPFLAIVWPVWRGVHVQPVEAIRVGLRAAKGGGWAPKLAGLRLPGSVVEQMSMRNLARTPRRTLLAVVGLAGVIASMVALLGIVDSFNATIDQSRADTAGATPNRLAVTLDGFHKTSDSVVRGVATAPGVQAAEPRVDTLASVSSGGAAIPVVLSLVNAGSRIWQPTLSEGAFEPGDEGIVIPEKLAGDLNVGVGDAITLERAVLGSAGLGAEAATVEVQAISANPFRVFTYMDESQAPTMGLAGVANSVAVLPAAGRSAESLERAFFKLPGVATTRPVTADTDALGDTIGQFTSVIRVAAFMALALAMLMAFNLAGISIDERRREYATMFAFGLPVRAVMRVAIVENLIVGILGTALGFAIGLLTISWIVHSLLGETWPEIGIAVSTSPFSIAVTVLVGVVVVALTPLVLARRVARMDIPSTLRVVE